MFEEEEAFSSDANIKINDNKEDDKNIEYETANKIKQDIENISTSIWKNIEMAKQIAQKQIDNNKTKSMETSFLLSDIYMKEAEFHSIIKEYDLAITECQNAASLRAADSFKLAEAYYMCGIYSSLKDGNRDESLNYFYYACKVLEGKLLVVQGKVFNLKENIDYGIAEASPIDTSEALEIKNALNKVHYKIKEAMAKKEHHLIKDIFRHYYSGVQDGSLLNILS